MRTQIRQRSIMFVLAIVLFAFSIGSSAQTTGRGISQARGSRIPGFPSTARKVAEELNPQPLPPCEKCGAANATTARRPGQSGARAPL
jgi:hypothetical protein